jgi:hypothetical protein
MNATRTTPPAAQNLVTLAGDLLGAAARTLLAELEVSEVDLPATTRVKDCVEAYFAARGSELILAAARDPQAMTLDPTPATERSTP